MSIKELINKNKKERDIAKDIILSIIDTYSLKGPNSYGTTFEGMTVAKWKPWLDEPCYTSALSMDRLYMIKQFLNIAPPGVCYECGVYTGGVTRMMLDMGRHVKAFDTFEGLTGSGEFDLMENGDYNGGDVSEYIKGAEIIKGCVPYTFKDHEDDKIAFAHLDMDLYEPTVHALKFIYDRLYDNGIIILDDYGVWMTPGIKKAVDEFHCEKKIYLPTGQMVILK